MPRLDQIVEHLFSHPRAELVLESNSTGLYREEGCPEIPVFRQTLRTGQILLLFAELVPREQSQQLLAGQPITFRYESPKGPLKVQMDMTGADIHVSVQVVASAKLGLAPVDTPPPVARDVPGVSLVELIAQLPERRATHLHLAPGQPAFLRVGSALIPFAEAGPFSGGQIREALATLAPASIRELVLKHPRFDFTSVTKESVFHVHAQESRGGLSVVVRALPREVPSVESLGVPPALVTGLSGGGLWVLAGAAGHGASTTMASLAQAVLNAQAASVCVVEAPIEYVLSAGRGLVQQLEVGTHVGSFAEALADARAIDSDLTVVGGLDDPGALKEALSLADRGRLVLGALHARTAVEAVAKMNMLLETRPLRAQLAAVVRGVFAQQLVPNVTGGRTLAWEVLPGTDAVKALVRDDALGPLQGHVTHSLDTSLLELVMRGEIEAEVALRCAADRPALEAKLKKAAHPRAA